MRCSVRGRGKGAGANEVAAGQDAFHEMCIRDRARNNIENRIPLHTEGKPEDVAELIASLVENDFITGENMVIDGGMTMRIV